MADTPPAPVGLLIRDGLKVCTARRKQHADAQTSVRRRFLGSASDKRLLACVY